MCPYHQIEPDDSVERGSGRAGGDDQAWQRAVEVTSPAAYYSRRILAVENP